MNFYLKLLTFANKGALFLAEGDDIAQNEAITKILDIVKGPVMTVIYIVLGALLAFKGAMLGTQIVKAADEPEVRQEKINSLKYLIIGVAVAYGVSFVAHYLVDYFAKQLTIPAEETGHLLRNLFNL